MLNKNATFLLSFKTAKRRTSSAIKKLGEFKINEIERSNLYLFSF